MKISLAMITLNEEENLPRALASARELVDDIIVVDSGSTDSTRDIAKRFEAQFIHQDWLGFVGQKNRALELAAHPWVLSLDADEELSPKLQKEIRDLRGGALVEGIAGFSMPRCVQYEGKWIRHGDWYPDRLVRLFLREKAKFEGAKVHERLVIRGGIQPLQGEIHHYSFKDATDHWARCEKYARLWAESQLEAGRTAGPAAPFLHAFFRFFRAYILRRGFLDGEAGFRIARFAAGEVALKYRLLREFHRASSKRQQHSIRG